MLLTVKTGRHTAQNRSGDTCGGGKPIGACKTTKELSEQLIKKVIVFEPNPIDVINPRLSWIGFRETVEMVCDECNLLCHAAARVFDGKPNERIRYMFEDPEAVSPFKDIINTEESVKAPIPTSFEGIYFKNDPNQQS